MFRKVIEAAGNRLPRSRDAVASSRSWQAKAPAPPLQADFPVVGQALSPANGIFSRLLTVAALIGAAGAWAQVAEVPGKAEAARICIQCHEYERSIAPRQNRAGWQGIMDKMAALGAIGTQKEFDAIVDYLARTYPGEEVPKIRVNEARAIELESGLSLPRSQAAAIIEYRTKHGDFKSIEDLKKVPGVDAAKIEAKKDRLLF
jgi:competence protein ComEA